ncbi:MAG: aminotransferase class IV [Opitutaceae bacterium]|nr:aminotransferase class IV [Opitutaceae bacterium]
MNHPATTRSVVLNGEVIAAADARISPLGDGFMYGLGLFETIKVLDGRLVFFPEHAERLGRSAAELGLVLAISREELHARCRQCIGANALRDAALKLVVYQSPGGVGELIVPGRNLYPSELYARGFRLKTMRENGRNHELSGHKTLNYLKCIRAKRGAEASGFDEALFVAADGAVLEGAISNVFVVKDGLVHTPSLAQGILPGIARAAVLRLLIAEPVDEGAIPGALLLAADEVFVTNSLLGVMPVGRVDERSYDLSCNPVTTGIRERFRALELKSASAE